MTRLFVVPLLTCLGGLVAVNMGCSEGTPTTTETNVFTGPHDFAIAFKEAQTLEVNDVSENLESQVKRTTIDDRKVLSRLGDSIKVASDEILPGDTTFTDPFWIRFQLKNPDGSTIREYVMHGPNQICYSDNDITRMAVLSDVQPFSLLIAELARLEPK